MPGFHKMPNYFLERMKSMILLVATCLLCALQAVAQNRGSLSPYSAAAAQYKSIQLDKAFSAFRTGSLHTGLILLADVRQLDPDDEDIKRLYSHCDSAIKYINLAKVNGDSSMFHEVMALALYQKLLSLEEVDFNLYRDQMPPRMLTKDMAYRYIPEERKIFFKELLNEALGEISLARGDLDKREKTTELTSKLKVIERSQKFVGTR
jgi:hypothetical protein